MRGFLAFRRQASVLTLLVLAGCGPLPRPFEHDVPNPLIEDRRGLSAISIEPIEGRPGLDDELVKALEAEDVPATTQPGGAGVLRLRGIWLEKGVVVWRLSQPDGDKAGDIVTPVPPGPWTAATRHELARRAAADISLSLRGDEAGQSDLDARPHVALAPLKAPKGFDADGLNHAMSRALLHEGLVVSDDNPAVMVQGEVRITPPPPDQKNGQDLLEVVWLVTSPKGEELGRIAQGNPVDHLLLTGFLGPLGRAIADAAAPGVAQVVEKVGK